MPAAIGGKLVIMSPTHGCRAPEECLVGFEVDAWLPVAPPSLQCLSGLRCKGLVSAASPVVLKHEGLPGSEVSRESSRLEVQGLDSAKRAPVIPTSIDHLDGMAQRIQWIGRLTISPRRIRPERNDLIGGDHNSHHQSNV